MAKRKIQFVLEQETRSSSKDIPSIIDLHTNHMRWIHKEVSILEIGLMVSFSAMALFHLPFLCWRYTKPFSVFVHTDTNRNQNTSLNETVQLVNDWPKIVGVCVYIGIIYLKQNSFLFENNNCGFLDFNVFLFIGFSGKFMWIFKGN